MTNEIKQSILTLKEIAHLQDKASTMQQFQLVTSISQQYKGLILLLELLIERNESPKTELLYLDGIILKSIYTCQIESLQLALNKYLPNGIINLDSEYSINYRPLYVSLISNDFKEANTLTQNYLNQLAQLHNKNKRQWLYFTDIFRLPEKDLQTIDQLWNIYSNGKFGFSIQRKIWLYNNKDWEKFWHIIGWKINQKYARYPNEFIWDNTAPIGHLPLFNQMRGVQVLETLFTHPVWNKEVYTRT